jgi:hypothetical protein
MLQLFARVLAAVTAVVLFNPAPAIGADWQASAGYQWRRLEVSDRGTSGFQIVAPGPRGVHFTNRLGEHRSLTNQIYLNGSGIAAGDVDGDDLCDLYFCGLDSPNALYRNLGGWRFEDMTASAGVACADQASTGAALVDIDGDHDLDLLVNGIHRGTRLFLNDGRGVFSEHTVASGLQAGAGSTSMALADLDGDARLDLYVVNYRSDTMRDMPGIEFTVGVTNGIRQVRAVNNRHATAPDLKGRFTFDSTGGVIENGESDFCYLNQGSGRFLLRTAEDGLFVDHEGKPLAELFDWGLSAMFRDLNGDGAPDLYVCNDFHSPDRLWFNDGAGHFREAPREALSQTSLFSMGIDFADLDRDGHDDFFVADMLSREHARRHVQVLDASAFRQSRTGAGGRIQSWRNTLFRNRGDSTFAEVARLAGVAATEWSWCPAFLDVDLDGYEDLLVTTGHWRDAMNADVARDLDAALRERPLPPREQLRLRRRFPRLETPNLAFRNQGDFTFVEQSASWGFDARRITHGLALADLDRDGDLDVIANCLNEPPLLYRNESPAARIMVRLRGRPPNTAGIGARVRVRITGLPEQSQEFIAGGRYLSSDEPARSFAAGHATNLAIVEVNWRSGRRTRMDGLPGNCLVEIHEPETVAASAGPAKPKADPLFTDVSDRLRHVHEDTIHDDFEVQPSLPWKLSELGPGVTWFDFNADGWDDLLVGAGRGHRWRVFRNDGQGGFIPQRSRLFETPLEGDLSSLLGWRPGPRSTELILASASYESATTNTPAVRLISLQTGDARDALAGMRCGIGPLALGDIDGDGDLDLFAGGRFISRNYPVSAPSYLFLNQSGRFELDPQASRALAETGLASGALFTDLNNDGSPELIVACEWGALRVFRWTTAGLSKWDPLLVSTDPRVSTPQNLSQLTGWWNSVAAGDFNNDGQMDIVAGNLGRNSLRESYLGEPIELAFAETPAGGSPPLMETHVDPVPGARVPTADLAALAQSFPALLARFPTFASFSTATVAQIQREIPTPIRAVRASVSESVLLLNRNGAFETRPLPFDAQVSPVFGIALGDFDGDARMDLVLAQNRFGTGAGESRWDAGVGVFLRGNGEGDFDPLPMTVTGIEIRGEGRGAAACDFNRDGRLDLAIGQHRGPTRLFLNRGALQGVRVRLRGSERNPMAIGARVRLLSAGKHTGPVHELRLGGGYWSQDGSELVLGRAGADSIEIRWPNGVTETVALPPEDMSVERTQP